MRSMWEDRLMPKGVEEWATDCCEGHDRQVLCVGCARAYAQERVADITADFLVKLRELIQLKVSERGVTANLVTNVDRAMKQIMAAHVRQWVEQEREACEKKIGKLCRQQDYHGNSGICPICADAIAAIRARE